MLWIFREYIYYGSWIIIPEMGSDYSKNFILISISETVAVLMSYPIRMKIRRVNTFFTLVFMIGVAAVVGSLMLPPQECRAKGEQCTSKFLYRIATMVTRFSIALIGNIMIGYTLEVYQINLKPLAYSFLIRISSVGSILLPWVN